MSVLVGVDAGASHTEVVVAKDWLKPAARFEGPGVVLNVDDLEDSIKSILESITTALRSARLDGDVAAMVVGAAGAGDDAVRDAAEAAFRAALCSQCSVAVTTDGEIALKSVFGDDPGITLCAGSGSIAYARDQSGVLWRAGGLGWQFGDEGSGYALARAALAAIGHAADGRGPATELTATLAKEAGTETVEQTIRWARSVERTAIIDLASVVDHTAGKGDLVAARLVNSIAQDLASLVLALVRHFPADSDVPVALGGGLLKADTSTRHSLVSQLHEAAPRVEITDVEVDAAVGALAMAARSVRE
jgi:N-acetylglucosamine kinase-like BadF-type ATPase